MAKTPHTISVIERRLQGPSVFRSSSSPIPMKDPAWTVRWENSAISPDHLWNILHNLGWVYATPSDLDCPIEEIGAFERDGRVVRGERGLEVLVKMKLVDYLRVQAKKSEEVRAQTFGAKHIKAAIVAGAGSALGEQAAEFLSRQPISVTDSRGPDE